MSATEAVSGASSTVEQEYEFDHIGIELEYPVATGPVPEGLAAHSTNLRSHFGRSSDWLPNMFEGGKGGYMGSDHTGAEITSGILDLHTSEPEEWYTNSISEAEGAGYSFAATGYGETVFGLHMHVSQFSKEKKDAVQDMCSNEWARVFFCSSIDRDSVDPWRHGGVSAPSTPFRGPRGGGEDNHWEFRLPEPMLPEHFGLVMDFMRILETEGPEAAEEFAFELVVNRDERLTPLVQYRNLRETVDGWPDEQAIREETDTRFCTDRHAAQWVVDLME